MLPERKKLDHIKCSIQTREGRKREDGQRKKETSKTKQKNKGYKQKTIINMLDINSTIRSCTQASLISYHFHPSPLNPVDNCLHSFPFLSYIPLKKKKSNTYKTQHIIILFCNLLFHLIYPGNHSISSQASSSSFFQLWSNLLHGGIIIYSIRLL